MHAPPDAAARQEEGEADVERGEASAAPPPPPPPPPPLPPPARPSAHHAATRGAPLRRSPPLNPAVVRAQRAEEVLQLKLEVR
jgi:hypothetical protein